MKGSTVYLEEDCDLTLLINTLGFLPQENYVSNDNQSKVRNYESYDYQKYLTDKKYKNQARNIARKERHEALTSLGLVKVRGALGGIYYE